MTLAPATVWRTVVGCLYTVVSVAAVCYVTLPLSMVAAIVGPSAGLGLAVVLSVTVLAGRGRGTRVIGPAEVLSGALEPRDPAWPGYLHLQHRIDLVTSASWTLAVLRRVWRVAWRGLAAARGRPLLGLWPLIPPAGLLLVGLSVGAGVGLLLYAALLAAVLLLVCPCTLAATVLLRCADRWVRLRRRARGCACTTCYHVMAMPGYRCACGATHRDLRPGRLGVAWRRCGGADGGCWRLLATTSVRAAGAMTPVCQRCGAELSAGAGTIAETRIAVFGDPASGKTQVLIAALDLLSPSQEGAVRLEDAHSRLRYTASRSFLPASRHMPPTMADRPAVMTLRVSRGRGDALVHLFDVAGESLADRETRADLCYLEDVHGLVFTVDPLGLPDVRSRLGGGTGPAASTEVYHATVTHLRDCGVALRSQRLALVVTKADLLLTLPEDLGLAVTDGIRSWLVDRGEDNLVLSAERDFGAVRFFLVASVPDPPKGAETALTVLRWLASAEGVDL